MPRPVDAQAGHLKPLLGVGERLIAGKGLVDRADAPPVHAADSLDVFRDRDHVVGSAIPAVTGEHRVLALEREIDRDARIGRIGLPTARSPGERALEEIGRAHSELQSLMRISYAVFCLKKKKHSSEYALQFLCVTDKTIL